MADKRQETAIFTDSEIDNALTEGGSVDGAVNYLLRVLIAAHAAKGDTARVASLKELLTMRGGDLPEVLVSEGAALPTDDAYVWSA